MYRTEDHWEYLLRQWEAACKERDNLLIEIKRLSKEELMYRTEDHWEYLLKACKERDNLLIEIKRLRAVVDRYARHDETCAVEEADHPFRAACDCGCDAATYKAHGDIPWDDTTV